MKTSIFRNALFYSYLLGAGVSDVWSDESVIAVNIKRLSLDTALTISQAAISECRKRGIHIGVVIIDRGGNTQVALRDTVAADITLRIAPEKAYAALSFNVPTSQLDKRANSPLGKLDGLVMAAGGLPINVGGKKFGAIGVSGAPTGIIDEECAKAGIKAVIVELEMQ
jgi:uncharacterized protein GlcG (DUF336 family)